MSGQFITVPREVINQIIQGVRIQKKINEIPLWDNQNDPVFPGTKVTLMIASSFMFYEAHEKLWGYPIPWRNVPLFNTHADELFLRDSMWRDSLETRRCIIPTQGFVEYHQSEDLIRPQTGKHPKQQYLFESPDSPYLFIAGIYEAGFFSMMTTKANKHVAPIKDKMPLVLKEEEFNTWIMGDYATLFNRDDIELTCKKV